MKRLLPCLLALFLLCGCAADPHNVNAVAQSVRREIPLLTACVAEMAAFGEERIYVAKDWVDEVNDEGETVKVLKLVSYPSESGTRTVIENEALEEALDRFGLALIFFQTASDSRQTVIFSYAKENDKNGVCGFYYSFDGLPAGWWGRRADLIRKDSRYLQTSQKEDAWYYTILISDSFYFFEKTGDLTA